METLNPKSRSDVFGKKINRDTWPILVFGIPWLTILLGSMTPMLPIFAPAPLVPPLGYLALLTWRLSRPGLLPLWAGFPLGLFDDLLSGQPLGSAIVLFSVTLITLDLIELRFPWRGFWQDWLVASMFLGLYVPLAALFSGGSLGLLELTMLAPQLLLSVILFPIIARLVALLDRLRLLRVRRIG